MHHYALRFGHYIKKGEMMKIASELAELCNICIYHFDELDTEGTGKIKVFSIELDSREIWAGTGDEDTMRTYYISKDGWLARETVEQTGLYVKGDGIVNDHLERATPESIEKDINGTKARIYDIRQLLKFYDEIHAKFRGR